MVIYLIIVVEVFFWIVFIGVFLVCLIYGMNNFMFCFCLEYLEELIVKKLSVFFKYEVEFDF